MTHLHDLPGEAGFLTVANRLSTKSWNSECDGYRARQGNRAGPSDELPPTVIRLLGSREMASEIQPLTVIHCYAEIPHGMTYEILFDCEAPSEHTPVDAEILCGVAYGRYVTPGLASGHHQTAAIRFRGGPPALLLKLPEDRITSRGFGLCKARDFPAIRQSLSGTFRECLRRFLSNPSEPTWSSRTLDRMFAEIPGSASDKVLITLPYVDELLSQTPSSAINLTQVAFLRALTLGAYPTRTITAADLAWLIERFRLSPLPHRALLLGLLCDSEELAGETATLILHTLRGMPGESFLTGWLEND